MKDKHTPFFPRADKKELSSFNTSSKICTMNCGKNIHDPRTDIERRFLCRDCLVTKELVK